MGGPHLSYAVDHQVMKVQGLAKRGDSHLVLQLTTR